MVFAGGDDPQSFGSACRLRASAMSYRPLPDRIDSGVENSLVPLTQKGATNVGRDTLLEPSVKLALSFYRWRVHVV